MANVSTAQMKVIQEKLSEWERNTDPKAPLSAKQRESIVELTSCANTRVFPVQLPLDEGPLILNSQILSATPVEKQVIPKYFMELQDGQMVIDNAQQFYTWFTKVEEEMIQEEDTIYNQYLEQLEENCNHCHELLDEIQEALTHLNSLHKQYLFVSDKTNALHEACEQLLQDQTNLMNLAENISSKLSYFNELDRISQQLNSPTLSVLNESFVPMLARLDECINYMISNPQIKEGNTYLARFRHCLAKALGFVRAHVVASLQNATQQVTPKNETVGLGDNAFTLFYGKYQTNAPKVKVLMEQIEERVDHSPEYQQLLTDCHQCYFQQREVLLNPSVVATINELASNNQRDHCALVRSGCAFLLHLCEDEYQLFFQFFSKHTSQLDKFLENLCNILYDVLRPLIIHINHLETLAELCSILKIEMIEEHVHNNPEQLSAFEVVATQMLQDVQERLVYRSHIYIQTDILHYNPAPGDLAYPEKLEMMESIAESLLQQGALSRSESHSSLLSAGSATSQEVAMITGASDHHSDIISVRPRLLANSPADLHGMWYPTVRRTLLCLSKLYRCIDRAIFQGLSQEALSMCIQSLIIASNAITKKKTPLDGQLFQIKHLLILREQIAPFQVDFAIKEMSLDFSKVKNAAISLLHKKSRLFALSNNNSLLEFIVQGTPQVTEHFIDSKKDVDNHLKGVCEDFISFATNFLVGPLKLFLNKANLILQLKEEEAGRKVELSNQSFASADRIAQVVSETNRLLKSHLPILQNSMGLYLANRETEAILFRPVRFEIQNAYTQLLQIVRTNYSEEEQLIIGCPSSEQVNMLLAAGMSK